MRSFLLSVGALLIVVLTAVFAAPALIDWNEYRGEFERQASAMLGREVRVGGDTRLRLLPTPTMHFEEVRIADASGRFDQPILRAEGITVFLAVGPLLQGHVEAREVKLVAPELRLGVDEHGRGNWRGLGDGVKLGFGPSDIALSLVDIQEGAFVLLAKDGSELIRLDRLNGELSAPSLAGPYRFRGAAQQSGEAREVKVSTAAIEPGGGLRFKATVAVPSTGNSFGFDGSATGLDAVPRLEGALEATVALDTTAATGEVAAAPRRLLAVKASLDGDLDRLKIDDISITFESDGKPQLVTGKALARLGQTIEIEASLASRWLDLDRLAGAAKDAGPAAVAQALARALVDSSAGTTAEVRFGIGIDQATIGGDSVGNFRLATVKTPERFEITRLSGRLPGSTEAELSGRLAISGDAVEFRGPINAGGASLARLLRWAVPGHPLEGAVQDGAFALAAGLVVVADEIAADDLAVELGGTTVKGSVRYRRGGTPFLELALASDRLDASATFAVKPLLTDVIQLLRPQSSEGAGEPMPARNLLALIGGIDSKIDLSFGEISSADGNLRDFVARLERSGGTLKIDRLAAIAGEDLSLAAEGAVTTDAGRMSGAIRYTVEAESAAAVDRFVTFAGLATESAELKRIVGRSAPMRLSGFLDLGRNGEGGARLLADGIAGDTRIELVARSEGLSAAEVGGHQLDLSLLVSAAASGAVVGQIFGMSPPVVDAGAAVPAGPGSASIHASGVPEKGLNILARLADGGLAAELEGQLTRREAGSDFDGTVAVQTVESRMLLALAGLAPGPAAAVAAIDGEAAGRTPVKRGLIMRGRLAKRSDSYHLTDVKGAIDGSPLTGSLAVDLSGPGRLFALSARMAKLDLPAILAPLLRARDVANAGVVDPAAETGTVASAEAGAVGALTPAVALSDAVFDFSALAGTEGTIVVEANRLALSPSLGIVKARLDATVDADGVTVKSLAGETLGGKLAVTAKLVRQTAGAEFSFDAKLDGGSLQRVVARKGEEPRATGSFSIALQGSGKGLSPSGLAAVLEGSGRVDIGAGEIANLSPVLVDAAARAVLAAKGKVDRDVVESALREARIGVAFPLGQQTLDIGIADGSLKLQPIITETDQSSLTITTLVDLQTLKLDSAWLLRQKPTATERQALPEVTFSYAGQLDSVATIEPVIEAQALERELTARKIIGDPEQIEALWAIIAPEGRESEDAAAAPDAAIEQGDGTGEEGTPVEELAFPATTTLDFPDVTGLVPQGDADAPAKSVGKNGRIKKADGTDATPAAQKPSTATEKPKVKPKKRELPKGFEGLFGD